MCLECQDFIKRNSKILDLGCNAGVITKNFQDFFQAKVIGADIQDSRIIPIPFKIINGKTLPFSENYFDVVLISYVLHHCNDPQALLTEAKRVVKDKIIIYEDLPEGFLSNLICKIHKLTFNYFFQKSKEKGKFKTEKEWGSFFNNIGLRIIFKKRINNFPVKKELFVLGM